VCVCVCVRVCVCACVCACVFVRYFQLRNLLMQFRLNFELRRYIGGKNIKMTAVLMFQHREFNA
jgi:hypothetical protein